MNGEIAVPCVNTIKDPKKIIIKNIGINQNFLELNINFIICEINSIIINKYYQN